MHIFLENFAINVLLLKASFKTKHASKDICQKWIFTEKTMVLSYCFLKRTLTFSFGKNITFNSLLTYFSIFTISVVIFSQKQDQICELTRIEWVSPAFRDSYQHENLSFTSPALPMFQPHSVIVK